MEEIYRNGNFCVVWDSELETYEVYELDSDDNGIFLGETLYEGEAIKICDQEFVKNVKKVLDTPPYLW